MSRMSAPPKSMREKLEGPQAVREIMESAHILVGLVQAFEARQPPAILAAKDVLKLRLARLEEIRKGYS